MKAQSDLIGDYERRAEMTRPRFSGVTFWMSISGISGMSKALNDISGIGSTLVGFDDPMGGISKAVSNFTRSYNPMCNEDEVNHCPAVWQQAVCNSVNSADTCLPSNLWFTLR